MDGLKPVPFKCRLLALLVAVKNVLAQRNHRFLSPKTKGAALGCAHRALIQSGTFHALAIGQGRSSVNPQKVQVPPLRHCFAMTSVGMTNVVGTAELVLF